MIKGKPHWPTFGWVLIIVAGVFLAYHFVLRKR